MGRGTKKGSGKFDVAPTHIVVVNWDDASWSEDSEPGQALITRSTVGFLEWENDRAIAVVQDYDQHGESECRFIIPRSCVRRMRRFKLPDSLRLRISKKGKT
jgi:hypothetical protein